MALVKKANDLIKANYNLSKNEQRLILYLLSTIQRPDKDFKEYEFSFTDLVEIVGMRHATVYTELKSIAHSLLSNPICFQEEVDVLDYYNWCSRFKINNQNKTISLSFHPGIKPYLLQLKANFTTYHLKYVSGFSSAHSFRIYEICKQYQKMKKRKLSIYELKDILDIADKYSQISALKAYVIKPAIKDINEHSDLLIKVQYYKTKRSITDIEFIISNKLESCKNEKQQEIIIEEVKSVKKKQAEKKEITEKSSEKLKIWNSLSDEEKEKKYGTGPMAYGNFRASFSKV
jgi:plasmid replication initiation protein